LDAGDVPKVVAEPGPQIETRSAGRENQALFHWV
jgi:hypothetical protein